MRKYGSLKKIMCLVLSLAIIFTGYAYADNYSGKLVSGKVFESPKVSVKLVPKTVLSKQVKVKITNNGSKTLYVVGDELKACDFYMSTVWKNGLNVTENKKDITGRLYFNGKYVKTRTVTAGATKTIAFKLPKMRTVNKKRGLVFEVKYDGKRYAIECNSAGKCKLEALDSMTVIGGGDLGDEEPGEGRKYIELTDKQIQSQAAFRNASMKLFTDAVKADAKANKSAMISPVSIMMMLSLAEAGAENNTLKQMEKAFGMSYDEMASWVEAYRNSITSGTLTKVNVANSFWYKTGIVPKKEYTDRIKKSFNADSFEEPFDQGTLGKVNKWCSDETYGMIPKLTDELDSDVVGILLNAVAFDGKWLEAYEDYQVEKDGKFTKADGKKKTVTLLNSTEGVYLKDDKATGVIKDYKEGFSFVAILPNEGVSVSDYLSTMTGESFEKLLSSANYNCDVTTTIPEFKYEYSAQDIIGVLKNMGITDLFSGKADLSGITSSDSLFISQIIHKTFIELNQEGTRAAAITGGLMKATSMPVEKPHYVVRLDRPFIYAIIDTSTRMPMFIGTMMGD